MLAHVVICTPYAIRSISASLYGIDPALEEASRVMGAGRWRTFRRILLPLCRPGCHGSVHLLVHHLVRQRGRVDVSHRADTVTLPVRILTYVEWQFDPSIAAISTILTV